MNSESLISIYHSAFIICAAFAILFLIISIVLFFVFNIPQTFNSITGRTRKRAIEEMSQRNASTGRMLSKAYLPGDTSSSLSLSTKLTNIKNNTTVMTPEASAGPLNVSVPAYRQEVRISIPDKEPVSSDTDSEQTMLLDPNSAADSYRAEPLKPQAEHTESGPPKPDMPKKITDTSKPDIHKADTANNSVVGISSSPVDFDIGMGETIRLSPDMLNMGANKVEIGRFDIIDEKMLIHTDEAIE